MKFAYKFQKLSSDDDRLRPVVPLIIINPYNNRSVKILCLLDTGADDSLFNIDTVNYLGHNLKGEGVKTGAKIGISGKKTPVWIHTFILKLLHPNWVDVVWDSGEIKIDCHEQRYVPNILGTDGFLQHFTITFDYQNEESVLYF